MDIKHTRKAQLRRWVTENGTPVTEKSFFSQLLNPESSFGERAARRLENDYKMGAMYLDTPNAPVIINKAKTIQNSQADNDASWTKAEEKGAVINANEITQLIALYASSTANGRAFILSSAAAAEKIPAQGDVESSAD